MHIYYIFQRPMTKTVKLFLIRADRAENLETHAQQQMHTIRSRFFSLSANGNMLALGQQQADEHTHTCAMTSLQELSDFKPGEGKNKSRQPSWIARAFHHTECTSTYDCIHVHVVFFRCMAWHECCDGTSHKLHTLHALTTFQGSPQMLMFWPWTSD